MMLAIKERMPVILLMLALSVAVPAADIDMTKLGEELKDLTAHETGQGQADLNYLEKTVVQCVDDAALRGQVEKLILDALSKGKTVEGKAFACRLLRTVGTAKSVPALEALLTNRELSHMARYALGRITAPEARAALCRGLENTTRELQAGIINTLALCRCRDALPSIINKLANPRHWAVATAAAKALGCFGGADAVMALLAARDDAPKALRLEIDNALLACAEIYLAGNEKKRAAAIYQLIHDKAEKVHLKLAGLRGLVAAAGKEAPRILYKVINGNDEVLSRNAIQMFPLVQGRMVIDTFMALYKSMAPDKVVLVIRALGEHRDEKSLTHIILLHELAKHDNEGVRLAAYEALIDDGRESTIRLLANVAVSGTDNEKRVAKASLVGLRGKGLARQYVQAMKELSADARVVILNTLGQRNMTETFKVLHGLAQEEENAKVRQEAILSMGRVGGRDGLEKLLALAAAPKAPEDRDAIRRAIETVFNTIPSQDAKTRVVLRTLKDAKDDMKPMLFMLLARTGTAPALNAVQQALKAENSQVRTAAVGALGAWPDAKPLRTLFKLATGSDDAKVRASAITGFIRLSDFAEEPTAMYLKALSLTKQEGDIKRILSGLGNTDTLEALEMALRYRKEAAFKHEATRAAVRIAGSYVWQDKEKTTAILNGIKAETKDGGVINDINRIFQAMNRFKGHIRAWRGAGPYTLENVNDGGRVFNTAFAPEKEPQGKGIAWRRIKVDPGHDRIDLERSFGAIDYCCAYLRVKIVSDSARTIRYRRDVDDFFKAWLNGKPVGGDQLKLQEGENIFMIKVGDHGGGWNFNCRLEALDGKPLEGVSTRL